MTVFGGQGKQSGLSIEKWRGCAEFEIAGGKVTRLSISTGGPKT